MRNPKRQIQLLEAHRKVKSSFIAGRMPTSDESELCAFANDEQSSDLGWPSLAVRIDKNISA